MITKQSTHPLDDIFHIDILPDPYFPSTSLHDHEDFAPHPHDPQPKIIEILKAKIISTDKLVRANKAMKRRLQQLKNEMKLKMVQNEVLRSQFEVMVENQVRNRMRRVSIRNTRQIKIKKGRGKIGQGEVGGRRKRGEGSESVGDEGE